VTFGVSSTLDGVSDELNRFPFFSKQAMSNLTFDRTVPAICSPFGKPMLHNRHLPGNRLGNFLSLYLLSMIAVIGKKWYSKGIAKLEL
jgi:hypothetical protein